MTPKQLIEGLGRDAVAERVGSTPESVRVRVAGGGLLPSRWFEACEEIASEKGEDCPKDCFAFARSDASA